MVVIILDKSSQISSKVIKIKEFFLMLNIPAQKLLPLMFDNSNW